MHRSHPGPPSVLNPVEADLGEPVPTSHLRPPTSFHPSPSTFTEKSPDGDERGSGRGYSLREDVIRSRSAATEVPEQKEPLPLSPVDGPCSSTPTLLPVSQTPRSGNARAQSVTFFSTPENKTRRN